MIMTRSSDTLLRLVLVAGISLFLHVTLATPSSSSSDIVNNDASFRDLLRDSEKDLASFLDQQQAAQDGTSFRRALEGSQKFGDRCGNNNQCLEGMDCTETNDFGFNRCLPNSCFDETLARSNFDLPNYKANLFEEAGYSESDIMTALAVAKNERAFLETDEFQALRLALDANIQPLKTFLDVSRTCIGSPGSRTNGTNGTVSYIGLHIEVSTVITLSFRTGLGSSRYCLR
jgi:hypothetical protein